MASGYTITTPSTAIKVLVGGQADVVYTVKNQTGRSVLTRAGVSPFPPTPPDWFTIVGEAERVFPPGGAEAFTVRVAIPGGATPGSYAFRLDAVAADRPDEDWGHGPAVGFELAPLPVPKPEPPPQPPGYIETAIGSVVGGAIASVLALLTAVLVVQVGFGFPPGTVGIVVGLSAGPIITAGFAFAGGVGAIVLLDRRAIVRPDPWLTAVLYGAIAWLVLTIVHVILARAMPLFGGPPPPPAPLVQLIVRFIVSAVVAVAAALVARLASRLIALGKP
jgi:hypothetical protein